MQQQLRSCWFIKILHFLFNKQAINLQFNGLDFSKLVNSNHTMEHIELLLTIEEKLSQIILEEELYPLRGKEVGYDFEGKNILEWYFNAVVQNANVFKLTCETMKRKLPLYSHKKNFYLRILSYILNFHSRDLRQQYF
jgi:hypothetical protein